MVASLVHNHNFQIGSDFDKVVEQLGIPVGTVLAHNRFDNLWPKLVAAAVEQVVAVVQLDYFLPDLDSSNALWMLMYFDDFCIDHSLYFDCAVHFYCGHHDTRANVMVNVCVDCKNYPADMHHDQIYTNTIKTKLLKI